MGTIKTRERKKGTVYRAEIYINAQRASASFDRRSDAQRWIEDTEYVLRNGGYIGDAPPGDMSFDKAMKRYLDEVSSQKAISTHRRELYQSGSLVNFFKGKLLKEILPADAAAFRDFRLKSVGTAMVRKDLNMLSHLFNVARIEWSVDVRNPVELIRKPKVSGGRLRFLTEEEVKKLLKEARKAHREKLYHYILLQLHTGMRPSEGAGLTWGHIDLDNRI